MASVRPLSDWKRMWWFPFMECRFVGLYLDSAPTDPVDAGSFWWEYRWAPTSS